MRRSYVPAASEAQEEQTREVKKSMDLKEKRSKEAAASSLSSVGSDNDLEKMKNEDGKKLERKPTEDINASAEAFIKNFRQQLMIQRLQSIENFEQMLARGL